MTVTLADLQRLREALSAARYSYCGGGTHSFYHYPARFSPDIARAVIEMFSEPGDLILDPFMGGGTSVIEGLCLGRRMAGTDLNALAHFVAAVRTTPLASSDEEALRRWASRVADRCGEDGVERRSSQPVPNLPRAVEAFMTRALALSDELAFPRQKALARCALLRLGQLLLDCRDFSAPGERLLAARLPQLTHEMLKGLAQFVDACRASGIPKNAIVGRRVLVHRSAIGLHEDPRLQALGEQPRLVFTSPPYPSVHVLYHRWQYRGRRETPAPYWIARVPDGYCASHYMGGSRTPTGRKRYFEMIEAAFRSVREVLDPKGLVVQLVGFSDAEYQLERYLAAMAAAGFDEVMIAGKHDRLNRRVPNRKWYARLKGAVDASSEVLLIHRPSTSRRSRS